MPKSSNSKQKVDVLSEDPPIKGQTYVVISFLSPERVEGSNPGVRALKVRGVYATREEAEARSKYIRDSVDPHFDVYVGEVGKWLAWDSREHTDKESYADEALDKLMNSYLAQQKLSKEELEKRRRTEIEQAVEQARKMRITAKNSGDNGGDTETPSNKE